MSTLVIHAPKSRAKRDGVRSFEKTFDSGVGDGYAIYKNLYDQLNFKSRVVLLDKDQELRAEGKLKRLVSTEKTKSGIQRYDIHVEHFELKRYKSETLTRCGVAVI